MPRVSPDEPTSEPPVITPTSTSRHQRVGGSRRGRSSPARRKPRTSRFRTRLRSGVWLEQINRPLAKPSGRLLPLDVVKLLLDRGADPNAGLKTPLLMRQHNG